MEKLKSLVPDTLWRVVAESTSEDLSSSCSSLLAFFLNLPQFHQTVRDLTDYETPLCGKNKESSLELKQKGNQFYSSRDYTKALNCYSQALSLAPINADDMDKNLVATLYLNRASVLQKMDLLIECLRDCNRALQISPNYAKAWYRRGKTNASLENYEEAVRDLHVAKNAELSGSGKRQIENELKMLLGQRKSPSSSVAPHKLRLSIADDLQIKLQCVTTPNKGRGMVSTSDIPQASLVHTEEPYAMIILKHCRETHCHYCLNELPADTVPCISCSMPLYCSQHCQVQAGGHTFGNYPKHHSIRETLTEDLEKHIAEVTLSKVSHPNSACIAEHKHECQGVHWPAILPSELVLAGRVLVKSIVQRRGSNHMKNLELSHSYSNLAPETKLEFHLYSIVLLCCLQHSYGTELPMNGVSVSQIVILISQIRVNSMAIVRMKSADAYGKLPWGRDALTNYIEQVRVGQAIYRAGSLFNHSCQPNIHAYFLSRTLFIRTTEFVAAGCPLELSYGPQVGQWDCKDRLKLLEDEYSFECQCSGCSGLNLSDLVVNAFHCVNLNCSGIVLDGSVINCKKQKFECFPNLLKRSCLEPHLQVDKLNNTGINNVAQHAFEHSNNSLRIDPGYCLKCGSYCDLESSSAAANKAWIYIRRLQDAIMSKELSSTTLSDALRSLHLLKSTLNAYNKRIAEAEDNLAQAFCLVRELQPAMDHCKASIEILEKLYNPNHIVIGYELVKLSSIQLSLGDCTTLNSINRLAVIFSQYYGSHADMMFPYLQMLKGEACKFDQ